MSQFKQKQVLIVGFGVSGVAVAKYMAQRGATLSVTDQRTEKDLAESIQACAHLSIRYDLGQHSTHSLDGIDYVVVSPGVSPQLKLLVEAQSRGIPITNEVELALAEIEAPLIAITGTNGKTTTTLLIGELLRAAGKKVFVGGNVGKPLLDYVTEGISAEWVVAELSSFQLESCRGLHPAVAIVTNLEEDHMDRYGEFSAYVAAKRRLIEACHSKSTVVLNYDQPNLTAFANAFAGTVLWFTKKNPISVGGEFAETFSGAYLNAQKKQIIVKMRIHKEISEETYDVTAFRLFGEHNKENLLAAICAVRPLGVLPEVIQTVIQTFKGVPHRLEFLRKKDGVFFFNDSKGTNVMSVQKSLAAFTANPIILIAGGKDKNSDFSPLVPWVKQRCKILILLGEAKEKINRALGDHAETYLVGTLEEAVLLAYQKSRSGDIILLSPGCASFDMFKNYEARGDYFKKLVAQI